MEGRRTLVFANLGEVMPEVDRLLAGHRTAGSWSLAQICNHLSASIVASVDGVSFQPSWAYRKTLGPMLLRRILRTGRFPDGATLPDQYLPRPGLDARAEAEALRATIRLFGTHTGPMADHPFGGPLTRENWERFHAIHSAHHLSFVVPEPGEFAAK